MMIEIKVDPQELPQAHSSTIICEDKNGYYALGYGDNTKPVVTAHLKKMGLYVIGGQSLREFLEQNETKMGWFEAILFYTVRFLNNNGTLSNVLQDVFQEHYQNGFRDGQYNLRNYFRRGLNLDHDENDCKLFGE